MASPDPSRFYFRAGTPDGTVFAGELAAGSEAAALQQLQQKGFVPLRLGREPIRERWLGREVGLTLGPRLAVSQCESFCRELALLLSSGIGLSDAMSVMLGALRKGSAEAVFVSALRNRLRLGQSLADAVASSKYRLPRDMIAVLRAGETSGSLATALSMLAASYAETGRFLRTYRAALAYPTLLLVVSIMVFGLIAFFVAPNIANLFVSMDKPIPPAISILAGAASFLSTNVLAVVAGVIVLGAALANPAVFRSLARGLSALIWRLPILGEAMRWSSGRRFAATLRLYLTSRVPMATALARAAEAAELPGQQGRASRLVESVKQGRPLASSLAEANLLPAKLVHLIAIGESGGQLLQVLEAAEVEAKARAEQRLAYLSTLLAPILILILGGLIGTVIFSVFSALLDINNVVM